MRVDRELAEVQPEPAVRARRRARRARSGSSARRSSRARRAGTGGPLLPIAISRPFAVALARDRAAAAARRVARARCRAGSRSRARTDRDRAARPASGSTSTSPRSWRTSTWARLPARARSTSSSSRVGARCARRMPSSSSSTSRMVATRPSALLQQHVRVVEVAAVTRCVGVGAELFAHQLDAAARPPTAGCAGRGRRALRARASFRAARGRCLSSRRCPARPQRSSLHLITSAFLRREQLRVGLLDELERVLDLAAQARRRRSTPSPGSARPRT